MKKFITAILALLYISTSTGAVLHMHYCMGELADWSLGHNNSETCGSCGMEKSDEVDNGCCKDEHKFIKNDTDQKLVESSFQFQKIIAVAIVPDYAELPIEKVSSVTEKNSTSHAPPRSSSVALYILQRAFLI